MLHMMRRYAVDDLICCGHSFVAVRLGVGPVRGLTGADEQNCWVDESKYEETDEEEYKEVYDARRTSLI